MGDWATAGAFTGVEVGAGTVGAVVGTVVGGTGVAVGDAATTGDAVGAGVTVAGGIAVGAATLALDTTGLADAAKSPALADPVGAVDSSTRDAGLLPQPTRSSTPAVSRAKRRQRSRGLGTVPSPSRCPPTASGV